MGSRNSLFRWNSWQIRCQLHEQRAYYAVIVVDSSLTLMHGKVTTIAENNGIAVLALSVVANVACRVFRRQVLNRLWNVLCLSGKE